MCPPLMYNVRVCLKRLGCLVARVFYHKWSKLGRIVNVDPKDTKNTKIVKILLKGPFLGPSTIVKRPFRHYSQNIF